MHDIAIRWRPWLVSVGMAADDPARTDAQALTFDLRLVVSIVTGALTIAFSIWASTTGIRSDVRDIRTLMDAQKQTQVLQQQLQDERLSNLRETVNSLTRRLELVQDAQQVLKDALRSGSRRQE